MHIPFSYWLSMKPLGKYMVFSLVTVFSVIGAVYLFKTHPEVQLAFIVPGFFIILFSVMRDTLFARPLTLRELREK